MAPNPEAKDDHVAHSDAATKKRPTKRMASHDDDAHHSQATKLRKTPHITLPEEVEEVSGITGKPKFVAASGVTEFGHSSNDDEALRESRVSQDLIDYSKRQAAIKYYTKILKDATQGFTKALHDNSHPLHHDTKSRLMDIKKTIFDPVEEAEAEAIAAKAYRTDIQTPIDSELSRNTFHNAGVTIKSLEKVLEDPNHPFTKALHNQQDKLHTQTKKIATMLSQLKQQVFPDGTSGIDPKQERWMSSSLANQRLAKGGKERSK